MMLSTNPPSASRTLCTTLLSGELALLSLARVNSLCAPDSLNFPFPFFFLIVSQGVTVGCLRLALAVWVAPAAAPL